MWGVAHYQAPRSLWFGSDPKNLILSPKEDGGTMVLWEVIGTPNHGMLAQVVLLLWQKQGCANGR